MNNQHENNRSYEDNLITPGASSLRDPGGAAEEIRTPFEEIQGPEGAQDPGTPSEAESLEDVKGASYYEDAILNHQIIYITDTEGDGLGLVSVGAPAAVAIRSREEARAFLEVAEHHPHNAYIFACNDEEGAAALEAYRELRKARKCNAIGKLNNMELVAPFKDLAQALQLDEYRVKLQIERASQGAALMLRTILEEDLRGSIKAEYTPEELEARQKSGAAIVEDFLQSITSRKYESIKTNLDYYDRITEGGFMRGELVTLGAAPGAGKTMFMQMLLENLAYNNKNANVLYINLEMSKEQLIARSITRLLWKYGQKDYTTKQILRGYNWSNEQKEEVLEILRIYADNIAPRFAYNPDNVTNEIDAIISVMTKEANRLKAEGRPAPIVCIDYLQLVGTKAREASEGIKEIIKKLKDFAINYQTCVIVILAHNRQSNESGVASVTSGRDTSAIEYSGDTMLTLSYAAIEEERYLSEADMQLLGIQPQPVKDKKEGQKEEFIYPKIKYDLRYINRLRSAALEAGYPLPASCQELMLKVVKSRFDGEGRRAKLVFDGKHASFTEVEKYHRPAWVVSEVPEQPNFEEDT